MPGSIGATPIEAPIDVEEGLPVEVPIVYFYGHTTPSEHPELYMFLVDRLASLLDKRSRTSPQVTPIACLLDPSVHGQMHQHSDASTRGLCIFLARVTAV